MSRTSAMIWRLPCDSSLKLVESNNPFIRFQLIRKLLLTVVCRLQILANQFRQVPFPKVSADHFELLFFGDINLSLFSLFQYHP